MSRNAEVAARLEEYADFLDAKGVEYKPRSYRRAADNVRDHPAAVEDLAAEDGVEGVQEVEGVGESIAEKVVEYLETGEIEALEELRAELPVEMGELLAVEGVGPKTVGDLYEALGVRTLDDLEEAARNEEIREVSGFGAKTEENILSGVEFAREARERQLLGDARPLGEEVRRHLYESDPVGRCDVCGSLRRWRETIGDVDVLAEAAPPGAKGGGDIEGGRDVEDGGGTEGETGAEVDEADLEAVVDAFTAWDRASDVIEAGTNKASIRVGDIRVDLRVVVPSEYGAALQYFTGSKNHNIRLRNHAIEQGLKINEYGVFDVSEVEDPDAGQRVGERIAGETERSVYDAVGVPMMPPELREDRGEIDAALDGRLPTLLDEGDVRGDLHTHTEWSDGSYTVREMVDGAAEFGHDYVCISDHGAGPGVFGNSGLDPDELRDQLSRIREVGDDAEIEVFAGVEANIGADGTVHPDDDVLAELDLVIASPHAALDGDATDRIVRAIEHPDVDVVGHPTGRLINQRHGVDLDVAAVAEAAAEHGVALEVNSHPHRLDLNGGAIKAAIEQGATVAVNTDAHGPAEYENAVYGVHTARRGWAEAGDVLNARDAAGVREFLGLD